MIFFFKKSKDCEASGCENFQRSVISLGLKGCHTFRFQRD